MRIRARGLLAPARSLRSIAPLSRVVGSHQRRQHAGSLGARLRC